MKTFKEFNDFESKKKEFNRLIKKRGDQSSNLTKDEQKLYAKFRDWAEEVGL